MFEINKVTDKLYQKLFYSNNFLKIFMKMNHLFLNYGLKNTKISKIIEVGGGAFCHLETMNIKDIARIEEYYIIDDLKYKFHFNEIKKNRRYKDIEIHFINYKEINSTLKRNYFDCLISSHTYEHVKDIEINFLNHLKFLKEDAFLHITLPCDPGLLWRFCQFLIYPISKKNYGFSNYREKKLYDSRQHINSIYNLLNIFKFYFIKVKILYLPFFVPIIDLNLISILKIRKKDFI